MTVGRNLCLFPTRQLLYLIGTLRGQPEACSPTSTSVPLLLRPSQVLYITIYHCLTIMSSDSWPPQLKYVHLRVHPANLICSARDWVAKCLGQMTDTNRTEAQAELRQVIADAFAATTLWTTDWAGVQLKRFRKLSESSSCTDPAPLRQFTAQAHTCIQYPQTKKVRFVRCLWCYAALIPYARHQS